MLQQTPELRHCAEQDTIATGLDAAAERTATDTITRDRLARSVAKRLAVQGMTLIEIMIVVVIMALVATGVSIAVIPQLNKAKIKNAKAAVQTVRSAVGVYMATNNAECATVPQLIDDKVIDKSTSSKDPWEHEFKIECDGTEITVTSAGPDGEFGTADDVQ